MTTDGLNRRLGRGINFGNALDAAEGGPRFQLRERYFHDVRNAGFSTVRLPVRWSAHAAQVPPYVISRAFFGRVDWAVSQALRQDLNVVLNVHHYDELNEALHGHRTRFLALWTQIAAHYASWPRQVVHNDLVGAAAWAHDHGCPLFIGEFGTYEQADMSSRLAWTRRVRLEADFLGLSWCYRDFGTDFGAFDPHRGVWREPLRDALIGTQGNVEQDNPHSRS